MIVGKDITMKKFDFLIFSELNESNNRIILNLFSETGGHSNIFPP
jgi:hypothetical protein